MQCFWHTSLQCFKLYAGGSGRRGAGGGGYGRKSDPLSCSLVTCTVPYRLHSTCLLPLLFLPPRPSNTCKLFRDQLEANFKHFEDCAVADSGGGGGGRGHDAGDTFFFVATDEADTQKIAQKVCHFTTAVLSCFTYFVCMCTRITCEVETSFVCLLV